MNIKKGDKVKIIAGKDNGKTGKVLQVFPVERKASVEGLNLLVKHLRPRKQGEQGQRIEFPSPIALSNLLLVCPKCEKPTRVGAMIMKGEKGEKKVRVCKKCKEVIN